MSDPKQNNKRITTKVDINNVFGDMTGNNSTYFTNV